MAIILTSTLSGKKESFVPREEGKVGMYACGPTVYGLTHVGNARPTIFFDVVRRFLEFRGFVVTFVSNYTDVDDNIINRAREEGVPSEELAKRFIEEFLVDCRRLEILPPDIAPKVTDHIPDIIGLIERLITCGKAYVTDEGEVLFSVRSFGEYGKLSKKRLDDLKSAVRIDVNEKKHDALDFALWKPQKASDEPAWESPWGKGRPGWHIECSAMAMRYLGETFDIHGGGLDLIHPHHENEIAQSEGATGKPFARVWLHNNLVNIGSEKMSKSVGNFFLSRDFMNRYSPEALRCLILSGHYRSPIDFSNSHIQECQAALHRFYSCRKRVAKIIGTNAQGNNDHANVWAFKTFGDTFESAWIAAMEDDLNTAKVIGLVFEYVRLANAALDTQKEKQGESAVLAARKFDENLSRLGKILNLFNQEPVAFLEQLKKQVLRERSVDVREVEKAVAERSRARANKDFATSDKIRQELLLKGVAVRDLGNVTEWDVVITHPPDSRRSRDFND